MAEHRAGWILSVDLEHGGELSRYDERGRAVLAASPAASRDHGMGLPGMREWAALMHDARDTRHALSRSRGDRRQRHGATVLNIGRADVPMEYARRG